MLTTDLPDAAMPVLKPRLDMILRDVAHANLDRVAEKFGLNSDTLERAVRRHGYATVPRAGTLWLVGRLPRTRRRDKVGD